MKDTYKRIIDCDLSRDLRYRIKENILQGGVGIRLHYDKYDEKHSYWYHHSSNMYKITPK